MSSGFALEASQSPVAMDMESEAEINNSGVQYEDQRERGRVSLVSAISKWCATADPQVLQIDQACRPRLDQHHTVNGDTTTAWHAIGVRRFNITVIHKPTTYTLRRKAFNFLMNRIMYKRERDLRRTLQFNTDNIPSSSQSPTTATTSFKPVSHSTSNVTLQ